MRTKTTNFIILLFILAASFVNAQDKVITGSVMDESGLPLPGASIVIKGTQNGTLTDFDGKYTINANVGDVLSFSFVGYSNHEVIIASSTSINVTLNYDNALEEVVVTALGRVKKKKSLGFAQQSVEGEDLVRTNEVDINNSLAGKVSGVQAIGNSGATFDDASIRLRGNTNVLYVVDGIRVQSASDINSADVESISVLKGGAATALYGTDASGGVVVITSKKARRGQSIKLQLSTEMANATNMLEYQNEYGGGYSQDFITLPSGELRPDYGADQSWGPKLDGTLVRHWDSWIVGDPEYGQLRPWSANPDNVKDFYETATVNKAILTFQNGGENHNISSTIRNVNQEGILPNSGRKTTQISINADFKVTEKLSLDAIVNYQVQSTLNNPELGYTGSGSFFRPNLWWQRQLDIHRLKDYKRNGQFVSWNIQSPTNPVPAFWDSPYFEFYENRNETDKNAMFGKVALNYEFNENLSASIQFRRTFSNYDGFRLRAFGGRGGATPPRYDEGRQTRIENELFGVLNYKNEFGADDKFDFASTLGFQMQDERYKQTFAQTVGGLTVPGFYSIETSVDRPTYTAFNTTEKARAIFGNVNLGYDDLIFLDATIRSDWSSAANPDDNRLITYGVSTSFIFSELFEDADFLSFGKLRGGISSAPSFPGIYNIYDTYQSAGNYNGQPLFGIPSTKANPLIKGASSKEKEIGLEMKFLNNKIGFDLTYFNTKIEDFPRFSSLASSTGSSNVLQNSGKETRSGFEATLNFTPVKTDNFKWTSSINFATIKWMVDEIDATDDPSIPSTRRLDRTWTYNNSWIVLRDVEGQPKGNIYGIKAQRDAQGRIIIDQSAGDWSRNAIPVETDQLIGNFLPDVTGGFNNVFTYKNLTLSASIDFQIGGDYYSQSKRWATGSGHSIETVGLNDKGNSIRDDVASGGGVRVDGVDSVTGEPVTRYFDAYAYFDRQIPAMAENLVFDASYVKLRQLSLAYRLPSKWYEKWGIENIEASIFGNNLWLIYAADEIDPSEIENVSGTALGRNGNGYRWAEGAQFPSSRTFGLNVSFTF